MHSSSQQPELLPAPLPLPGSTMVNHRVSLQTEGTQRVVLVHGIRFANYSVADRAAEAYALVSLFEAGMVAFQIESDLVEMIRPRYKRVEDEGRTLVQNHVRSSEVVDSECSLEARVACQAAIPSKVCTVNSFSWADFS